jgi:nucleotide-binding universal stress UspA family protein
MKKKVCPVARLEKLLIATDGSEYSESAIREAINLAKICSSKLIAVSVIRTNPEFEATVPQIIEKAEEEAIDHLESIKSRASKVGIDCEFIIHRSDEPYQDIVAEALKNQVNMIILGTHGRTGLKRLMMGSVTAKVIGHAPCNVMVVPRDVRITLEKILIATDGSIYSELASREAINIAKVTGASIIALSVAKKDENIPVANKSVDLVRDAAEREGIKVEALTLKGEPYEVIVKTAKKRKAGLICVGSHGRTGIERLLMGSVTERVIGHAESAVLVVKVIKA